MSQIPLLDVRINIRAGAAGQTKLLAFAELTIDGAFVIKGIRIWKRDEPGNDEPFVTFPAEMKKGKVDRWLDIAHPITGEARAAALAVILAAYNKALEVPNE